jgi:hypothetical protein
LDCSIARRESAIQIEIQRSQIKNDQGSGSTCGRCCGCCGTGEITARTRRPELHAERVVRHRGWCRRRRRLGHDIVVEIGSREWSHDGPVHIAAVRRYELAWCARTSTLYTLYGIGIRSDVGGWIVVGIRLARDLRRDERLLTGSEDLWLRPVECGAAEEPRRFAARCSSPGSGCSRMPTVPAFPAHVAQPRSRSRCGARCRAPVARARRSARGVTAAPAMRSPLMTFVPPRRAHSFRIARTDAFCALRLTRPSWNSSLTACAAAGAAQQNRERHRQERVETSCEQPLDWNRNYRIPG